MHKLILLAVTVSNLIVSIATWQHAAITRTEVDVAVAGIHAVIYDSDRAWKTWDPHKIRFGR